MALVTAPTRAGLDRATQAILSRPNECRFLTVGSTTCVLVSPPMNLEARLTVEVNGRTVAVPLPATVEQALAAAGANAHAAVSVWRPFHGRERRVLAINRADLLKMLLAGGEHIETH